MYSMKQTCELVNMNYEGLKFYCNEGLIPNVKRNSHNHRVFDDKDIAWIQSLTCLKDCGMTLREMKEYLKLCLEGKPTILARKEILARKRMELLESIATLYHSVEYIDQKQQFYDDVLAGTIAYHSNLIGPS